MASVLTSIGRRIGGSPRQALVDMVSALNLCRDELVTLDIANLATATAYHIAIPEACTLVSITTVVDGSNATGTAILTSAHNGTGSFVGITTGVVTIAADAVAGEVDSAVPTALNVIPAGSVLRLTKSGTADASIRAQVSLVLRKPVAALIS